MTSAIGVLGAAYALHLIFDRPPVDTRAAVLGAGLLAAAELAFWSIELRREVAAPETGRQLRRLTVELALCLGGLALAALVLAATDVGHGGNTAVQVAGAAAAIALAVLAVAGLRRSPS
jgi:peptidoglycan/LPS O-acetylase OafA/YrhL